MPPAKGPSRPSLLLLIALAASGPMALNMFMPSMPGMVAVFNTDYGTVQLTLTLYLTSMAVAQLFVGPLADRFGRRPVVLWGLGTYILGSVLCLAAPTIEALIAGRVVQAVGGCAGLVMGRTMVRDLYDLDKAAKMMAYLTMVMVVAPILAPSVGGLLDHAFGWWAGFAVVGLYGLVILAVLFRRLGETHKGPFMGADPRQMLASYGALLRLRRFHHHTWQISLSSAAFFAFLGGAPYVTINLMGRTAADYGLYFMIGGVAYSLGNFLTGRLAERLGSARLIGLGTSAGVVGGAWLTTFHLTAGLTPLTLFSGMAIIAFGNGLCLPTGTAAAVGVDPSRIGAAAGLSGFIQMALGSAASSLVGYLLHDTAGPLVAVMTATAVLGLAVHLVGTWDEKRPS
ncbi:MAG: multidrug effflux MFS transporter [Rhodobacterales bacterium]|nr:multidrug effflux MFS transporter [Rhodobacterales bacterium]